LEYLADGLFAVVNQGALFHAAPEVAENLMRELAALTPEQIQRHSLAQILPAPLRGRQDLCRYRCSLPAYVKAQLDRARERGLAEVRIVIKTPDDLPYLPGTSLKGALRTALAYAWTKGDAGALATLKRAPTREKWRIVEGLLRAPGTNDVTRDVLRALEIGDSVPLQAEASLAIAHEAVLSAAVRRDSNAPEDAPATWKGFPTFLETIRPGVVLEGRITLRDRLLSGPASRSMGWTPRQQALGLGDILAAAKLLAADAIAWELRFLARVTGAQVYTIREFYERLSERMRSAAGNEAYLCLGRGAGWHKSTVGLLLEEAEDFDFARFRREGGIAERRGQGFDRTDFDFPKTRKFIMENSGKPFAPLGWVRLVLPGPITEPITAARIIGAPPPRPPSPPHVKGLAPPRAEPGTRQPYATAPPRIPPGPPAPPAGKPPKAAPPPVTQAKPSKATKASEKAKREQEAYLKKLRGEPES
jgi:CRISPR-associated protein Csm5